MHAKGLNWKLYLVFALAHKEETHLHSLFSLWPVRGTGITVVSLLISMLGERHHSPWGCPGPPGLQ